jgi:hypothetical protein
MCLVSSVKPVFHFPCGHKYNYITSCYMFFFRHYATIRKVAGSSPDEVFFFQLT